MCYKFDPEGSPMFIWRFNLLIDEKPFEALIHSFTREGALKRLNILARRSKLHAHYIRDINELQGDELCDYDDPAHKEYVRRRFAA
jgi:hypothetical protein